MKYGEAVNRHANFRTASNGIQMLFRIVTGEDWNRYVHNNGTVNNLKVVFQIVCLTFRVLHDSMLSPPYCTRPRDASYWETDCGNFVAAIAFFCR